MVPGRGRAHVPPQPCLHHHAVLPRLLTARQLYAPCTANPVPEAGTSACSPLPALARFLPASAAEAGVLHIN